VQSARVISEAEAVIAALDLSAPSETLAALLVELEKLTGEAEQLTRGIGRGLVTLGRPGPLAEAVASVAHEADLVAARFAQLVVAFRRGHRATRAGALSTLEARELILSSTDFASSLLEELRAVIDRARDLDAQARQYYDDTFTALWSDPARNAAEAELDRDAGKEIEAGRGFRGSIDDLIKSIDG
jgi:hypothetical protein